jgi:hypothetical protein
MSALNIKAVATITANNAGLALTTSAQDLIAAIATSHVALVDSIYASNVDGAVAETITVRVVKSGPLTYHLAKTISVPAGATVIIVSKEDAIELMEGDKVTALAGSSSKIEAFASWKDLS